MVDTPRIAPNPWSPLVVVTKGEGGYNRNRSSASINGTLSSNVAELFVFNIVGGVVNKRLPFPSDGVVKNSEGSGALPDFP